MSPTDPWWKRTEIAFRRGLLRALGMFIRRSKHVPPNIDFSRARVVFIRQDRIGDVLVSTPLLSALHTAFPSLVMDMIVSPNNVGALAGLPMIDRAWVYNKRVGSMAKMLQDIRRERYDLAVDLMDNPSVTSSLLCMLSGAEWTVGLEKENAFTYDIRVPLRSRKDVHIVDRLGELLRVFGLDPGSMPRKVMYEPSTHARQEAVREYKGLGVIQKVKVGVNISAGSGSRFWGVEHYREFISNIARHNSEWMCVLLAKPSDLGLAQAIQEGYPTAVLGPPTPAFDGFAGMVEHLDLLLTPDTSVVHLASAFQIPCVVLYVQSNAELRIWDPYHTPHQSVITTTNSLGDIPIAEVRNAWDRLIAEVGEPRTPRSQSMSGAS